MLQRNQIQTVCLSLFDSYPLKEYFSRWNVVKLVQRCVVFSNFPALCSQIYDKFRAPVTLNDSEQISLMWMGDSMVLLQWQSITNYCWIFCLQFMTQKPQLVHTRPQHQNVFYLFNHKWARETMRRKEILQVHFAWCLLWWGIFMTIWTLNALSFRLSLKDWSLKLMFTLKYNSEVCHRHISDILLL